MATLASINDTSSKSFNGAMAVRPWMATTAALGRLDRTELQWGHGREAMDGRGTRAAYPRRAASMGPWP